MAILFNEFSQRMGCNLFITFKQPVKLTLCSLSPWIRSQSFRIVLKFVSSQGDGNYAQHVEVGRS